MKKKVIIDCDNTMGKPYAEIDDGLTILYLLGRDDLELLGITNCYANASLQDVEYWTKRFLYDIEKPDLPRFSGQPFSGQNQTEWFTRTWGHHFLNERKPQASPSDAARFLVEQADRSPGEVHVLALGSMTNLFEAESLDPDFFKKLAGVYLMGGVLGDLKFRGRRCLELNLACNPEAAHRVLNNGQCPVVVMNANICLQAPFNDADLPLVSFWPERRRAQVREWLWGFQGTFYLWDLLPAVYLSYPELFDDKKEIIASTKVDLEEGILVRGESGPELVMPENILDVPRFMDIVTAGWRTAWERERADWK